MCVPKEEKNLINFTYINIYIVKCLFDVKIVMSMQARWKNISDLISFGQVGSGKWDLGK